MPDLLVVRPGAIGDALLAFPALAALRSARPADRLLFIAHPAVGPLALRERLADHFIPRDAPAADALFAPDPALARARFPRLDAAIAWTADPSGLLSRNLAALGANPLVVAPSRPPETSATHVARHLLDTLAPFGVRPFDPLPWTLPFASNRPGTPRPCPPPSIVLHPGSGSPRKDWPAERFAALAEAMHRERQARLTVLAGPADDEPLDAFAARATAPFDVYRDRPLEQLADLLANCRLYVGNDSGLSHLAGLVGAPTLALFGPTDPHRWRPLGPRVRALRAESLDRLGVDAVLKEALGLLGPAAQSRRF